MKFIILLLTFSISAFAGLPPTTSKDSADSVDSTTFKYRFPNFTGTHTGTIFSLGVNSIAGGGTGAVTANAALNNLLPDQAGTPPALPAISGIIQHLIADTGTYSDSGRTTPVTANGASVVGWADQSGTGNDATSLRSSSVIKTGGQNGHTAITLTTDAYSFANLSGHLSAAEIFMVVKMIGSPGDINVILSGGAVAGGYIFSHYGASNFINFNALPSPQLMTTMNWTNTLLIGWSWDGSGTDNGLNGTYVSNSGTTGITGALDYDNIGNYLGNPAYDPSADIYEVIAYNRKLTGPERTSVLAYLNGRYAIYGVVGGANGKVLQSNGTDASWVDTSAIFGSQTQNTFFSSPDGSSGDPVFRAIVAADIPTLNQNTSGTAAGLSSTLVVGSGGTGTSTAFTPGSVAFAGTSGVYSQDNARLFWDEADGYLGIGTNDPHYVVDVAGRLHATDGFVTQSATSAFQWWSDGTPTYAYAMAETGFASLTGSNAGSPMWATYTGTDGFWKQRMVIDRPSGFLGVGVLVPGAMVDVGGAVRLEGSSSGYTGLISAATAASNTFILPSADGSPGQALRTDGSLGLTFGTLSVAGGGTGQTTAANAINALVPTQTSNSGKFLTTNGSVVSWDTPAGGGGAPSDFVFSNSSAQDWDGAFPALLSNVLSPSFSAVYFGSTDVPLLDTANGSASPVFQSGVVLEPTSSQSTGEVDVKVGDNRGLGDTGTVNLLPGTISNAASSGNVGGVLIGGAGNSGHGNGGDIKLQGGNTSGGGNAGNIILQAGQAPSGGGAVGKIQFIDGSEGTSGHIWTSADTVGNGHWAAAAASGVTTVGTFGSTPTANAANISGSSLTFQPADATNPGMITTGSQTIAGAKTFSGGVVATVTGTASGNLTATPSNHGMLISSGTNTVTVLAPDASTTKVWTSGGSSADPGWGAAGAKTDLSNLTTTSINKDLLPAAPSAANFYINSTSQVGDTGPTTQAFAQPFVAGVTGTVTDVKWNVNILGSNSGILHAEIRDATINGTVLTSGTLSESSLSSGYIDFSVTPVTLTSGNTYFAVFWSDDNSSQTVVYYNLVTTDAHAVANPGMTSPSGSWSGPLGGAMIIEITGTSGASPNIGSLASPWPQTYVSQLLFPDSDVSHSVGFAAPSVIAANILWTLPSADGSANQVLSTDGAGTLSWLTRGTGNLTATPSNHGMLISSATNAVTVLAPDVSTTKVWTSGGSSADPSWAAIPAGTVYNSYSANQYGVVLSGTGTTMSVIAPDASTTKVLTSGGSSANPGWAVIPTLNQNTTGTAAGNLSATPSNHGMLISSGTNAVTVLAPDASTTKVWTSAGASANPGWQAIPTLNQNTSGTAAGLSSTLVIGSGGTGATTANTAVNNLLPAQYTAAPTLPAISGIIQHLMADTGTYSDAFSTPVTSNGASVVGWADQSGAGNDATSMHSHSVIKTGGWNGQTAITVTADAYSFANTSTPLSAAEIFMVVKKTGSDGVFISGGSAGDGYIFSDNGATNYTMYNVYAVPILYSTVDFTNPNLLNWSWDSSGQNNGVNGAYTSNSTTGAINYNNIGNYIGTTTFDPSGDIYEIIAYNRKLTSGERTSVLDYLNGKYVIYAGAIGPTIGMVLQSDGTNTSWALGGGSGTEYADGAAHGTSTGTLIMVDDGTNIQSAAGTTAGVLKVDISATAVNGTAIKTDGSAVTQPVSIASLPSGAVTNTGTFAVQAAEADGANVTLGTKADAKSTATDTTAVTIMSVLKQISASSQAPPSSAVTNAGTFAVQAAQSTAASLNMTDATGVAIQGSPTGGTAATKSALMGGIYLSTPPTLTTGQQSSLMLDADGSLYANIRDALPAGSNVIGHVINDASSAVIGHVIADSGSTTAVTGNVAVTEADGANVTLGTKADAKSTATDTTAVTIMSVLKQISASSQAPPSSAVTNAGTFAVQAAGDVASGSGDSGNPVKIGGLAKTAQPTAVTDGQRVNILTDKLGRQVVTTGHIRDLVTQQTTTIASSSSETTILTAVASTFLDITSLVITNGSATIPVTVTIKDTTAGTTVAIFDIAAGGGIVFNPVVPWKQTTVNTNWTATLSSAAITVHFFVIAEKNI